MDNLLSNKALSENFSKSYLFNYLINNHSEQFKNFLLYIMKRFNIEKTYDNIDEEFTNIYYPSKNSGIGFVAFVAWNYMVDKKLGHEEVPWNLKLTSFTTT